MEGHVSWLIFEHDLYPSVIRQHLSTAPRLLRKIVVELMANDPLRMAGATAFFTSFALPPIIMIIVRIFGIFVDKKVFGKQLMDQLSIILGPDSREAIVKAIHSFIGLQHNVLITCGLFLFLIFVATTLFKIIKNSINQIWKIRKKSKAGIAYGLKSRGLSIAVILLAGVLFFCIQFMDAGVNMLRGCLPSDFPTVAVYTCAVLSKVIVLAFNVIWFFVLFSILPDARPHWRVATLGAILTTLLFNFGKWVLQYLLQPGNVRNFYGASGALVLVLLFVFYSSLIVYFGAAFIKVWGEYRELPMRLKPNATKYRLEEIAVD